MYIRMPTQGKISKITYIWVCVCGEREREMLTQRYIIMKVSAPVRERDVLTLGSLFQDGSTGTQDTGAILLLVFCWLLFSCYRFVSFVVLITFRLLTGVELEILIGGLKNKIQKL